MGGEAPRSPEPLFAERGQQIKNALVARGVDPRRILIAPTNATREGGPWASVDGVRIEVTNLEQLRDFPERDPSVRRAVR
jgi:hypothetical protein